MGMFFAPALAHSGKIFIMHPLEPSPFNMRIDLRRRDIRMSEHDLNRSKTPPAPLPAGNNRLAEVLQRGTIRIGTTGDFNPMSFRNPGSNDYIGFESRR